jgi:hypothetical protein
VKSSPNPYLTRIASLVGEKDPLHALSVFVETYRTAGESLEALACRLGVSRIFEQTLPYEGGLFKLPDGELVIKLNSESSFVRKRFTLAHEIAHLFLNTVPAFRSTHRADAALERTCDMIAAELLMPTVEATDFVHELGSPSPEKLRAIASKYAVSMQTAAIRVHDSLKLWKCSVGMWERSSRVKTIWFVGRRRFDAAQPDPCCLDLAFSSRSSVQTKDLWQRGDSTDPVWLNLLGIGNNRVLGLVDFAN